MPSYFPAADDVIDPLKKSTGDIFQPGVGWVPVSQIGRLPSYNPQRAQEYTERGLPYQRPVQTYAFGERKGDLQGAPLSAAERTFWSANPMGATLHPETGELVGLGTSNQGRDRVLGQLYPQPERGTAPAVQRIDTDALINTAIARRQELQGQRSTLEAQRDSLIQRFRSIPLGRRERETPLHEAIKQQIRGLDIQERELGRQETFAEHDANLRMSSAFRNASIAEKDLERQRHTQTATQAANLMNGVARIEAQYQHGTPEFRDAMENLVTENHLGLQSAAAAARVRASTEWHDKQAERLVNQSASQLLKMGFTPQDFANLDPNSVRATNYVPQKDKPLDLQEIEKQRANEGGTIAFNLGGRTHVMDRNSFEKFSSFFRPNVPAQSAPAQTQVDPRVALAQRALNDPNATEAHKAAARKILGLQ